MMRQLSLICLLLVSLACQAAGEARRIVSLAPNFTELVYAVGGEKRLVGTVSYSDYPPAARQLPRVGDALRLDLERLLALRPDLILVWRSGTPPAVQQQLRELGLPLWVREADSLDSIARLLEELGGLTGQEDNGRRQAAKFRQGLAALRQRYAGRRPVRLFYQISERPLMTVNHAHIIDEAIRLCGGGNIFSRLPGLTPTLSVEAVYLEQPELLVLGEPDGRQRDPVWLDRRLLDVPVAVVPADLMHRATPRMLQGIEQLCEAIDRVRLTISRPQ